MNESINIENNLAKEFAQIADAKNRDTADKLIDDIVNVAVGDLKKKAEEGVYSFIINEGTSHSCYVELLQRSHTEIIW